MSIPPGSTTKVGSLLHLEQPGDRCQDEVEEEDEEVDVDVNKDEDEYRGDDDKREEKNEVGEAERCKQVVEHGCHRPEKLPFIRH